MPPKGRPKKRPASAKRSAGPRRGSQPKARPKPKAKAQRGLTAPLKLQFEQAAPRLDPQGREFKRVYKLDTLESALTALLSTRDDVLIPSVHTALGNAPVTSLRFELSLESVHRLVFRCAAGNARRKSGTLAFIAAKQDGSVSRALEAEWRFLAAMHRRAPKRVLEPYYGGALLLTDRHHRRQNDRWIFAYCTAWLHGLYALGAGPEGQFACEIIPRLLYSRAQSEQIKSRIVTLTTELFEPREGRGLDPASLSQGGIMASKPGGPSLRLVLNGGRDLVRRTSPEVFIERLLNAEYGGPSGVPIAPADPREFAEALRKAVGRQTCAVWVSNVQRRADAGKLRVPHRIGEDYLRGFFAAGKVDA